MEMVDLMREIHFLTGEGKGTVYEAALIRAEKKSNYELQSDKLKSVLAAIKDAYFNDMPVTKGEVKALADSRYRDAIIIKNKALKEMLEAEATWAKRLNRLEGVKALLIAEQTIAKNLK